MLSRWTIGAMASKKASASSPVQRADRRGEVRRSQRSGRDDDVVPLLRRQPLNFPAFKADQRMGGESLGDRGRKAVAVNGQSAAGRHLWVSAACITSEPKRRISACSSPMAEVAASSERKELEQTNSARRRSDGPRSAALVAFRAARPGHGAPPTAMRLHSRRGRRRRYARAQVTNSRPGRFGSWRGISMTRSMTPENSVVQRWSGLRPRQNLRRYCSVVLQLSLAYLPKKKGARLNGRLFC